VARQAAVLILAVLLACAAGLAGAVEPERLKTPQVPWTSLTPDERRVLEPVAPEWPRMPGYQQERLKGAARRYPTLQPIQKERFDTRIRDWATMTPDQRKAARETFQGLRKLPPEKQHELRERWLDRHQDYPSGRQQQGYSPGYPAAERQQRYGEPAPVPQQRSGAPQQQQPVYRDRRSREEPPQGQGSRPR